jgi:ketosteroid isomerase-like protein
MQRVRAWIAVCVLVGLAAVPAIARAGQEFKNGQAPPQGELTPEEQELVQLERAWDAAFVAKDIRFIERVLADEFVATYGDGTRGDKAAELAQTLDFDQQVNSSVLDSFRVRIYGDTALVWFSRHMTGPKSGKVVSVTYRFVDVFVKRAGRWQCVSSQSTRVTPAGSSL